MPKLAVLLVTVVGATLLSTPAAAQPANDEQQLRDIQQRLARAWLQHDRAFIETVLAPEWSVTQPDGQLLTRATVLGPFFDRLKLDSSNVDDVSVMLFGTTAVVRGRTVAAGMLNDAPVSARIRFTDVFIKRDGRWQAVASHASPLQAPANGLQDVPAAKNPFVGNWTADLSKSALHANSRIQATSLQFAVVGDIVSITDTVINASGHDVGHGTTILQTDGKEHPHDELMAGLEVVARWRDSHILETVLTRKDGQVDRITYEVSVDGKTLTTTTSGNLGKQVIVFDRK